MWPGQVDDPGGPGPGGASSRQESEEPNEQLVVQLKEMLRKSDQTVINQGKLEEYANELNRMYARAKKNKLKKEGEGGSKTDATDRNRKQLETPAKGKINLLRQQMEENKAKLAERGKSQKGIEEMVIQLKAQLDDSQNMINQSPLNLSLIDTRIESYSANSSSQELYKILLNKEKRISDLINKVQKLEANVMDLQENVKEKEQVIDARTKAITLMSESLSKKGKNTLDALEETKEQMRQMQANFIQLETDMKSERQALVAELQRKMLHNDNLQKEVSELNNLIEMYQSNNFKSEENNERIEEMSKELRELKLAAENTPEILEKVNNLQEENSKYLDEVKQLEEVISNLKGSQLPETSMESGEMVKLKKQLEESNKNMIKIKAQSKSKIKELNKKLDAFKKISDSNAEIVRLGNENSKLNTKVAELEEEKLQLQKRIDDTDSIQVSRTIKDVKELETDAQDLSENLIEKDKEIVTLKEEIKLSREEITALMEQLSSLSYLKNAQVASQLDSIAFEEQLDKLESEKQEIMKEKLTLIDTIEELKKEKQEITGKLESYVHENSELIDKLEKLSGEKVSSAESIEFVEGLTQQEKLELEAYQKSIDLISANVKNSRENLEQNPELNESVSQLTEETSELLQKIELFTLERREVMEKMEVLSQENIQLHLKLKEVENNRDVLAETYEQLQNEKDILDNKLLKLEEEQSVLQEQLNLLQEENVQLKQTINVSDTSIDNRDFEKLVLEVEELKSSLESLREERNHFEVSCNDLRQRIAEYDEKEKIKDEDINTYQSALEDAKTDLISSSKLINDLQTELQRRQDEIRNLNASLNDLNVALGELENENCRSVENSDSIVVMETQLKDLKEMLNQNIEQIQRYEEEMEENSKVIAELKQQTNILNNNMLETEHLVESKNDEINKLIKELEDKDSLVTKLGEEIKHKDETFHSTCNELKQKYESMQNQIEQNSNSFDTMRAPLEAKIEELTMKNKEQLEKMKKIAANLKKKTVAYQELEEKYTTEKEKWETETTEKDQKIAHMIQEMAEVEQALEYCKNENSQEQHQMQLMNLQQEMEILRSSYHNSANELTGREQLIAELREEIRTLSSSQLAALEELRIKDKTITQLQEEFQTKKYSSETENNALLVKIRELEAYIETRDAELASCKERVAKLEEGLSSVEDRRLSLERKAIELGAQLEEKSHSFEEISQTEDALEKRLQALITHDEIIEKRLQNMIEENQQLLVQNNTLVAENEEFRHKVDIAHRKVAEVSGIEEKVNNYEIENSKLNKMVTNLENELKHLRQTLHDKNKEMETADLDMQEQFVQMGEERKSLLEQIERLTDDINEFKLNEESLREEISLYRVKLEQQQNDLDVNMQDIEYLRQQNEVLQMKVEELRAAEVKKEENPIIFDAFQPEGQSGDMPEFDLLSTVHVSPAETSVQNNLELEQKVKELEMVLARLSVLEQNEEKYKMEIADYEEKTANLQNEIDQLIKPVESVPEKTKPASLLFPEATNDPFSFVNQPVDEIPQQKQEIFTFTSQPNKNNEEELLKKIKTLEFMLYSVEKEKDDALLQCHELSNELTRLLYERESKINVESQILSAEDLVDTLKVKQELHGLEFEPTNPAVTKCDATGELVPIEDEECTSKTAYLCYPEPDNQDKVDAQILKGKDTVCTPEELRKLHNLEFEPSRPDVINKDKEGHVLPADEGIAGAKTAYICFPNDPKLSTSVESQIVGSKMATITLEGLKQLHDLEFEKTKTICPQDKAKDGKPVIEDTVHKKDAYLCYDQDGTKKDAAGVNYFTFGENDDGWGWGPEESKLDEVHLQQTTNQPQVAQLLEKIRVLEVEREQHSEDIKQLQIKSGKLVKKLKEFKLRNDQLNSQLSTKSSDFTDLDDAIQDELKSQIANLEKRILETNSELERERAEKENMRKRIDVLATANERMVDMKEKQDIEIMSWQQRNRELSAKLQQFDWGDDGFEAPSTTQVVEHSQTSNNESVDELERKIRELNETIKDLALDNEELQVLLEEQRTMRIKAERTKSIEPIPENMKTETEYLNLLTEKNNLDEQLLDTIEEKKHLEETYNNLIKVNEELQQSFDKLFEEKQILEQHNISLNEIKCNLEELTQNNDSESHISELSNMLTIKDQELVNLSTRIEEVNKELAISEQEKLHQTEKIQFLEVHIEELQKKFEIQDQEKLLLNDQLRDLHLSNEETNDHFENNVAKLTNTLNNLGHEKAELNNQLRSLQTSFEHTTLQNSETSQLRNQITVLTEEKTKLFNELQEKNAQIFTLNESMNALRAELEILTLNNANIEKEFDEKLSVTLETVAQEWMQRVDQRGSDVAESWKLHLESRENEFVQSEQQLRNELNESEEKCNALVNENNELRKNVDAEIRNEVDRVSALQQQISDKQQYISELTKNAQDSQRNLEAMQKQLLEYETNFIQFNTQISDEHFKISSLQEELAENLKLIDGLNNKIQTSAEELKHNQNKIEELVKNDNENNNLIQNLQLQIQQLQNMSEKNECNSIEELQSRLQERERHIEELNNRFQEIQNKRESETLAQIFEYQQQLQLYQNQLEHLNNELANCGQLLQNKEVTIVQLNTMVQQHDQDMNSKLQEHENLLTERLNEIDTLKRRINESESSYEELLNVKDADMNNLRLQLQEEQEKYNSFAQEFKQLQNTLTEKIKECETLQKTLSEQNLLLEEESKQMSELRKIIEDQVLKIEELKEDLYEKSNDYDALIAEMDIQRNTMAEQTKTVGDTLERSDATSVSHDTEEDDLLEPVSRAELDLALYMLHQRDMRCEELTVELTQLLEERDTLQLRLSNALREKEQLRSKIGSTEADTTANLNESVGSVPSGAILKKRASEIFLGASGTEQAKEAVEGISNEHDDPLANKLFELKTVGYRKDKTIVDEQQIRRLQQMSVMEQHREAVSKLPPEAAARLVDASYTLSRDVQSPSKVLLNWLWGKSTPKVNDI